jgi:hypothetical protein
MDIPMPGTSPLAISVLMYCSKVVSFLLQEIINAKKANRKILARVLID